MMILFFILFWPIYYIKGMRKYDSLNSPDRKKLKQAIEDETREFREADQLIDFLCELSDVIHTHIKYFGYEYNIYPILIYLTCCVFAPYTAAKHGYRYYHYGCIRNQPHCLAKNHNCVT